MVVLEWFLYLVGVAIGFAAFRIYWWLYPKRLSRWKRYRMSEYDFFTNRMVEGIAAALAFGGVSIYFVYQVFHKDLLKPKEEDAVEMQSVPAVQGKTPETSVPPTSETTGTLPLSESRTSEPVAEEPAEVVRLWDKAHNQRNYALFDSLYMDYVRFYGQEWEKQQCIDGKKRLLQLHPDFFQQSKNIRIEKIEEGILKVTFDKQAYYDGVARTFPSYLWLNWVGDAWKIEVESDEVTDANLR